MEKLSTNLAHIILKSNTTAGGEDSTPAASEDEIPFTVPVSARSPRLGDRANLTTNFSPQVHPRHRSMANRTMSVMASTNLGSLNPELYKSGEEGDHLDFPDGHIGRLWFSVEYVRETEKLIVNLIKVRNLPNRETSTSNSCDPFVRIFLSPDERNPLQSKTKRKSSNPRYDEAFSFAASRDNLTERTLRFVVYDQDSNKRQTVIGHAVYPVKDCAIRPQKFTTWLDLRPNESETSQTLGDLHCSLSYNNTLEQVTVSVIEVKHLFSPDKDNLDTYAKVNCTWLGAKQEKPKKTKVVKKCLSPVFNESFMFRLPADKLEAGSVSIQIVQVKQEQSIGRVVLGGELCTKGKSLDHWKKMVCNPKDVIQDWHPLTE